MPLPQDRFIPARRPTQITDSRNEELQEARRELTAVVKSALGVRTNGRQAVRVGWEERTYAKMVGAGHKIVGYPETMVFGRSNAVGGIERLKELKAKWESGEIHFADATADDKRRAERNPRSVFPGKRPNALQLPYVHFDFKLPPPSFSRPLDTCTVPLLNPKEVVHRPLSLVPCCERPLEKARPVVARRQRADTKKSRGRKTHSSRSGVKTLPFVAVSPTKRRGEPSAKRAGAVPTHDRIDGYEDVPATEGEEESDEIEGWLDPAERVESDPLEDWLVVAEGTGKWKRKRG